LRLFESKSNALVGLDIGVSAVKLVELKGSPSSPSLSGWAVQPIPPGAVSENAVADVEKVIEAVGTAVTRSRCSARNAAVAVSASHAITKVISMPAELNERELEEQVEVEALHYVPYPMEDVNLDFEVLGPSASSPDNEVDVLLAACRREIVEDYIAVVEGAGLTAAVIDIDTYALERAYRFSTAEDGIVALLDIGALTTHLGVFDNERVLYTRHQNFGAKQLTDLVRRRYNVSEDEATRLITASSPPEGYLTDILPSFVEMATQEASRALQFFYSSTAYSNIDSVLLTGGCSVSPGLAEDLSEKLNAPVRLLNPVANFSTRGATNSEALQRASGVLGVASGLALRGL
jgi:type IV pilus assembly protein PilM